MKSVASYRHANLGRWDGGVVQVEIVFQKRSYNKYEFLSTLVEYQWNINISELPNLWELPCKMLQ